MEMSSLIKRPAKPIESRITSCTIVAEVVAGATGSMAVNTTCAVIPNGSAASGRKAAKSVASSVARSAVDHRQRLVAVRGRAAVAWNMLEHRQNAAVAKTLGDRIGDGRHRFRVRAVGAVADHRSAPATGTSAIGRQSTSMPNAARSAAINRAPSRAAASPSSDPGHRARHKRRPVDKPANPAAPAAARVHPPGRSGPAHRGRRPSGTPRSAGAAASGPAIFRLKRIKPHGCASLTKPPLLARQRRSGNAGDERAHLGRLARAQREGQASRPSVPLDNAAAAGSLQVAAHPGGLLRRSEWPDQGAVIDALGAEIGAADDRLLDRRAGWDIWPAKTERRL